MSNIISIQGYTLHRHNNDLMVEDLELARRLGYGQERDIRKLIKRMLETGQLTPETVCATVAQNTGERGRPSQGFHLNEKAALKVITKSETKMADKITDEMIDVFIAARNGELRPRRQDEVVVPFKRAEAVVRSTLSLCRMLGTEKAMARVIAVDQARKVTGLDITPMLPLNAVKEVPLTPTELGKELGMSGKAMNAALALEGFQYRKDDGDWEPTEKGRKFCTMNPYKSPNSEHTGYRPMWFKSVLDALTKAA